MEIVFLPATISDLRWFRRYYTTVFPEGYRGANQHYRTFLSRLKDNPTIGRPVEDGESVREYSIPRTPFAALYRVHDGRIEVLRLYDQRSDFSNRHLRSGKASEGDDAT